MISKNELMSMLKVMQITLVQVSHENVINYNPQIQLNPLTTVSFRNKVVDFHKINSRKNQNVNNIFPTIFQDNFGVCFAYFQQDKASYYLGPMSLTNFSNQSLQVYADYYGLNVDPIPPKAFLMEEIFEMIGLVCSFLTGSFWTVDELLRANQHLAYNNQVAIKKRISYDIRVEEVSQAHHTLNEERYLLDCVKRGAVEEALAAQNAMDTSVGRLSNREVNHWKNLAIVAITLTTRAAIDGGLHPALAYKISDNYIQQCDRQQTIAQLITIRNHAVQELTENVRQNQKIQTQSSYIKACMAYIDRHYREKIYLEDVANYIGLSDTYFSKVFKKEVGMTFQSYVIQVRLKYAANLLCYSNEPIPVISEYVNFPTQSYFGRYFKKYYHITPKEYRNLYHIYD
jgi:AraC-like DNA-binding protein